MFQAEYLHDAGVDAEGHRGIALLHFGERFARDAGTLRHRLRGVFAAQPGQLQIAAIALQETGNPGQQRWDAPGHNEYYLTPFIMFLSPIILVTWGML